MGPTWALHVSSSIFSPLFPIQSSFLSLGPAMGGVAVSRRGAPHQLVGRYSMAAVGRVHKRGTRRGMRATCRCSSGSSPLLSSGCGRSTSMQMMSNCNLSSPACSASSRERSAASRTPLLGTSTSVQNCTWDANGVRNDKDAGLESGERGPC